MLREERGGVMTLGERCDEIVRLINETLGDLPIPETGHPSSGASSTRLSQGTNPAVREPQAAVI